MIPAGRRLRYHLTGGHGLAWCEQNADLLAGEHQADHHAGVSAGQLHAQTDYSPRTW